MGYTTDFEGIITITPPASQELVKKVNEFCEERHGGNTEVFKGFPGFWCDYVVSDDGTEITWNGSEKSYYMEKWLPLLIEKFFAPAGHTLNGNMKAQGEDASDMWLLLCEDNKVSTKHAKITWE